MSKRTTNQSTYILLLLTIIFATVGLLVKWAMIQRIHNEIIDRYETNQSIYYTPNSICQLIDREDYNLLTVSFAAILIFLFILTNQRTSCLPHHCHGYGALPVPVDFLSYIDRTFATVVFAIISDELVLLLDKALFGSSETTQGIVVVYILRIVKVLEMGFRYYPLLAAVYINSIFALICATFYAWFDYAFFIINQGMCNTNFYPTYDDYLQNSTDRIVKQLEFYGTGSGLIALDLCSHIPKFLCLGYIITKLPMLLLKKIRFRYEKNVSNLKRIMRDLPPEQRMFFYICQSNSSEMIYVRNLFLPVDQRLPSRGLWARLIPNKIYQYRDDFRFSTRVLCLYSSIFLFLYFVAVQAHVRGITSIDRIRAAYQGFFNSIAVLFFPVPVASPRPDILCYVSNFSAPPVLGAYLFAVYFALLIIVIQLLVFLTNIRRNLLQVFRGDYSEVPRRRQRKYIKLSDGNIHFAGFFIGYLIWALILITVLMCTIAVCFLALVSSNNVRLLEMIITALVPVILFAICKITIDHLLARYVFLQDCGDIFALNNRRLLMIFIYFNFFFDAFLGFIAAVMRLVKTAIAAIFYMCRLDYSPMGRKLEMLDGGFLAYCGFLHTECVHRHPVLLVFVSHLYTQLKLKQWTIENMSMEEIKHYKSSSRWIRKWKLVVFLMRNPKIVFFRKAFLKQLPVDTNERRSSSNSMEQIHRF